jgi:capreomycidine synthase
MEIASARLENWMRQYYFDTDIDIGSSGVQGYSFSEIRQLLGLSQAELDNIVFEDSRTLGAPDLRKAIACRWGDGDPERVIATHGSSEAIFLIMNALIRKGDEVLVLDPCYQQLYSIAESVGCRLKTWPLRFEQGFIPDVEEAAGLITPRTRMVVVNFPHNPTGASLTLEQQAHLIKAAERAGAYLLWDAAFAELTYEAPPLPDATLFYERAISLGTLSKAFGLPGLRVGWCLTSPEVLPLCAHIRDYVTLHLSPLVEYIAQRVIESTELIVAPRLQRARRNLGVVAEWVSRNRDMVVWVRPQGGVCAFVRLRGVADVDDFCRRLAEQFRVLLVPGSCFNRPDHVRLGFGGPTQELEDGLSRLSTLLSNHSGASADTHYSGTA